MFSRKRHSRGLGRNRAAMALVVTLALLLLVTILILTFFSQATLNRQISFASAAQSRADNLSQTAMQTIVNDLREEMAAGSTITANASTSPTYVPTNNLVMVPQRLGSTGLTNLVKMSVGGSNLWSGTNYRYSGPIRSIAGNSTINPSANGRYLPLSSWFTPQLLTSNETNLLKAPDWVLVTRQGPLTNAPALTIANFTNRAASNPNYVIGRYAYTVYDIGGLLDANVAGYPSTAGLSASDLARKGSLSLVALTNLPDITQTRNDALVNWRIPQTNYASTNYYSYVRYVATTNGFLRPMPGGGAFFTRQDLIKYATLNGFTNALPFLTSFSREKNTPSWKPSTPSGSTIDYAGNAESDTSINRDFANLRLANATTLIKSRFDLDRLAWLTYKGPSANLPPGDPLYDANGSDANIKKYFGLAWDSSPFDPITEHGEQWVYTSPDVAAVIPSTIKTLAQAAALGREPDFFELLKAGILSGSLGVYAKSEQDSLTVNFAGQGNNGALVYRPDAANTAQIFNRISDYQVLAIGANILTQYTSDGYPQFIQTPGGNVIGAKSMPFQYSHGLEAYRPIDSFANTTNRDVSLFWLKFTVWNPYRNATASIVPATGPTQFRIRPFHGVMQGAFQNPLQTNNDVSLAHGGDTVPTPFSRDFSSDTVSVNFTNSPIFINPTPLSYTNTTVDSLDAEYGAARYPSNVLGKDIAGIYLGKFRWPDGRIDSRYNTNDYATQPEIYVAGSSASHPKILDPVDLRSQYVDAKGNWRSYQLAPRMLFTAHALDDNATPPGPVSRPYTNTLAFAAIESAYPDPRDRRFGLTSSHAEANNTEDPVYATFRSDALHVRNSIVNAYTGPNFTTGRVYSAYYADNISGSLSTYSDLDGITRPGDGNGSSIPPALSATAGVSRPLILNAPFHTIGDIGYTYRDLPWKSLDFFTAKSADAGLLDLFTLSGGMINSLPIVAGKVNINSAPAPVLKALLDGAAVDFASDLRTVDLATTLSATAVSTLVTALRPSNGNNPLFLNKADLVSFFSASLPTGYTTKGQREAPIRVLADVTQTRTWNLLIDVVAQAGRYAPGASGVDKFVVEGEKHYWLQVAIDRFTGEIVDQQLEPVYEQ